ncbi:MAG: 4-alpha-glucanotransferase [Thermoanaerobaculia bacterium]
MPGRLSGARGGTGSGRRCGVLLPLFSLPGAGPIGGLGGVGRWARALAQTGHSVWQVLPPGPTAGWVGNSPYSALSSFALDEAWLGDEGVPTERVDWEAARRLGAARGRRAARELIGSDDLAAFRAAHAAWVEDWGLYAVLRRALGRPWYDWPEGLRDRAPQTLAARRAANAAEVDLEIAAQCAIDRAWQRSRGEVRAAGVEWMGDLPFYPAHDSADVWAHPGLFELRPDGRADLVAGCPPDAYSDTGQYWGNPVYRWAAHRADGFRWWAARLGRQLELFDTARLDHFRGLAATWQIPARAASAAEGSWVESPGDAWVRQVGSGVAGRLVAEDLGVITEEVHALRRRLGAPGSRVVQFAFGDDHAESEHLPERCPEDRVLYSSTHDSPTLAEWMGTLEGEERSRLQAWLGRPVREPGAVQETVQRLYASPARLVVVTVQDVLGLGRGARINRPGEAWGQWEWRLAEADLEAGLPRLEELATASGRRVAR